MYFNKDFYCVSDISNEWCKYYNPCDITITGSQNDKYTAKYVYQNTSHDCILHDYNHIKDIGYSFNGYYQQNLQNKCVDKNHYDNFIKKNGLYHKTTEFIRGFLAYSLFLYNPLNNLLLFISYLESYFDKLCIYNYEIVNQGNIELV